MARGGPATGRVCDRRRLRLGRNDDRIRCARRPGRRGPRARRFGTLLERARERAPEAAGALRPRGRHSPRFAARVGDLVVSRFGVMFFADPGASFANLRTGLKPGGRLVFACWREAKAQSLVDCAATRGGEARASAARARPGGSRPVRLRRRDARAASAGRSRLRRHRASRRGISISTSRSAEGSTSPSRRIGIGPTSRMLDGAERSRSAPPRSARYRSALAAHAVGDSVPLGAAVWFVTAKIRELSELRRTSRGQESPMAKFPADDGTCPRRPGTPGAPGFAGHAVRSRAALSSARAGGDFVAASRVRPTGARAADRAFARPNRGAWCRDRGDVVAALCRNRRRASVPVQRPKRRTIIKPFGEGEPARRATAILAGPLRRPAERKDAIARVRARPAFDDDGAVERMVDQSALRAPQLRSQPSRPCEPDDRADVSDLADPLAAEGGSAPRGDAAGALDGGEQRKRALWASPCTVARRRGSLRLDRSR